MNRTFGQKMKIWALCSLAAISSASFTSCTDEVDEGNRFTFTGQLISDYLESSPEKFSSFCEILSKAKIGKKVSGNLLKTLSTYGSYTCFAPTNEAVDSFIAQQYALYLEGEETGITSPYLQDISDSMATVIAKNHLIELAHLTTEVGDGESFPTNTMNGRITTLEVETDENGRNFIVLNNKSRVIDTDLKMENGVVHVINEVLSPSQLKTAELLAAQPSFSVFNSALEATGLHEILTPFEIDPDYDNTEKGPFFETQKQTPPVPQYKNKRFTLLVESNDLLADSTKNSLNMAITNFEELEAFAEHWYGTKAKGDYTNPENAVYQFVAYHIIDRQLSYGSGSGPGGFIMQNYNGKKDNFNSEINMPTAYDRYDYFETYLPYTMIKVTKPFSNQNAYYPYSNDPSSPRTARMKDQIIINYAQDAGTRCNNPEMAYHMNVVVEDIRTTKMRPGLAEFDNSASNGIIHTLDRILIHNEEEMAGNILRERMRWDIISLFPELTNNEVRWQQQDEDYTLTYIPENYCERLRTNNTQTHVYYLRPHSTSLGGYVNFQGDEMLVTGKYDFEYRLPHVPAGTYEIRFGFSQSDARGVAQFYLDGKICGIPVDMRNTTENQITIGWFDETGMTEEEIRQNDKAMRNRGFMKAPASCHPEEGLSMRESVLAIRKIIGTFQLDKGDHWLRFKDVMEAGRLNEFNQDYIEIVPTVVISDPSKPEDNL